MTKTERAYLAGLIDGEGCVTLFVNNWNHRLKNGKLAGSKNGSTLSRLHIAVCDKAAIDSVAETVGFGKTYARSPIGRGAGVWKQLFTITWTGKRAVVILKQVLPYLRIKRRQAEILIEWVTLAERERHFKGRNGGPAYPEWVIAKRDAFVEELRALNRRGVTPR